jgi:hypothetical protein
VLSVVAFWSGEHLENFQSMLSSSTVIAHHVP